MPIYNESGEIIQPVTDGAESAGVKEQEAAAPASTVADSGAKEQEPAAPAAEDPKVTESIETGPATELLAEPIEPVESVQSKEKNRKFAADRRAREIEEARREAQAEVIKAMGIRDPSTGKLIDNLEDYKKFSDGQKQRRLADSLRDRGIDPDVINEIIEANPAVAAARAAMEKAKAAEEKAKETGDALTFDKAIMEVSKRNPQVKNYDDLAAMPEFDTFKRLVGAGFTFGEAYDMATAGSRAEAEKQAAYNAVASKSHLGKTPGHAVQDYGITDQQFSDFRQLNPNATRAEAAAAYKKYGK